VVVVSSASSVQAAIASTKTAIATIHLALTRYLLGLVRGPWIHGRPRGDTVWDSTPAGQLEGSRLADHLGALARI
jgi:hypothetical protein